MAKESVLPSSLVVLGEALRAIALKLHTDMASEPVRIDQKEDMLAFASRHLATLSEGVQRLESEINEGMAVMASPADAHRAAGRLEVQLEHLLAHYDEAKSVYPSSEDAEGRLLVLDVYRSLLIQTRRWLDEVVEALNDPIAALKARGLPTEGRVELPLTLTIRAAPQLEQLTRWAEERAAACQEAAEHERKSRARSVFWATFLGAIGLGWIFWS